MPAPISPNTATSSDAAASSKLNASTSNQPTRREFLKSTSAAMVGGTLAASLGISRQAHAAGSDDTLKVALIGCGGRGTGAAGQALATGGNVKLVAMADAFPDRI